MKGAAAPLKVPSARVRAAEPPCKAPAGRIRALPRRVSFPTDLGEVAFA